MQSRVRGEESPTLMHSSRGSGCARVCRPCITNAHPTTIVAATPDVRNARLFIFLSSFGYRIHIPRSKAVGRKGRVATALPVPPSPSELPAVHTNADQILLQPMVTGTYRNRFETILESCGDGLMRYLWRIAAVRFEADRITSPLVLRFAVGIIRDESARGSRFSNLVLVEEKIRFAF
jgi:hypothetical protein